VTTAGGIFSENPQNGIGRNPGCARCLHMHRTMMVYVGVWLCPRVRRPRVRETNQLTLLAALPESVHGTQEKALVRPANMPGIWGIPDIDLRASSGGEHGGLDPFRTFQDTMRLLPAPGAATLINCASTTDFPRGNINITSDANAAPQMPRDVSRAAGCRPRWLGMR
jgi:hypothetical protein